MDSGHPLRGFRNDGGAYFNNLLGLRVGTFAILVAVARYTARTLASSERVGRGRFVVDIAMTAAAAATAALLALWLVLLFAGIG